MIPRGVPASLVAMCLMFPPWAAQSALSQDRPATWARPIDLAGVPNLHWVADNFYRSAQPDAQGFKALATQHGVRKVISLRAHHSDKMLAHGLDMGFARFPMHTWHIKRDDVVGALRTLRRAMGEGPVLLHCQHGADRTGLITALYRITYEGWSKEAALEEMRSGNFGYHAVWGNIPKYIEKTDVDQLKREIGVP